MATQKIRIKLKSYEHTLISPRSGLSRLPSAPAPACRARFRSPRRRKS